MSLCNFVVTPNRPTCRVFGLEYNSRGSFCPRLHLPDCHRHNRFQSCGLLVSLCCSELRVVALKHCKTAVILPQAEEPAPGMPDHAGGLEHHLGVDRTWGSCSAFAVWDGQATVEDCGSGDGNSVSPFWRPPHPSALSHVGIGNIIDRTLGAR